MFQENIDVRPHLLILNKVDLTDLSDKQVRSRRNMLLFYQIIIILKSLKQKLCLYIYPAENPEDATKKWGEECSLHRLFKAER